MLSIIIIIIIIIQNEITFKKIKEHWTQPSKMAPYPRCSVGAYAASSHQPLHQTRFTAKLHSMGLMWTPFEFSTGMDPTTDDATHLTVR